MRKSLFSLVVCAFFALLLTSVQKSVAQTAGTLTVSFNQPIPTSPSGTKNVIAVWIEDNAGTFIKTKMRYVGGGTSDHLPNFGTKAGGNSCDALTSTSIIDATSGATRSSTTTPTAFGSKSFTWNGTNVSAAVVTDGIYKIWIESSWQTSVASCAHNDVISFSFTKGTATVHLTPTGDTYFNTIVLDWVPSITAVAPTVTTTAATSILQTTASSGGNVSADGGATVTARGVCWGTTANPVATGSHTSDATGTGIFTSSITGLTAATLYHYRAYATNSVGTSYGTDLTFTTAAALTLPTVVTMQATSITQTTASAGGSAQADGGAAVTAKGLCWGLTTDPTIAGSHTTDGTGIGTYISNMTGLTPGTLYHIRAYATNSVGTAYGTDMTFTTLANSTYTVSGTVNYLNTTSTALANVTVTLTMVGTTTVLTTTTNGNGFYSFSNVANGSYTIACSTTAAWGGVTAIDALKLNRHIAGLEVITTPVKLTAGDLNLSSNITASDVLLLNRRAAGLISSFTRPDWVFEVATVGGNSVTVNGANMTVNMEALCAGDFNGSYIPVVK